MIARHRLDPNGDRTLWTYLPRTMDGEIARMADRRLSLPRSDRSGDVRTSDAASVESPARRPPRPRVLQVCRARSWAAQDGGRREARSSRVGRRDHARLPPDPPRRPLLAREGEGEPAALRAVGARVRLADWMPDKWQRIGACETGYGKRPGDFHWNSGAVLRASRASRCRRGMRSGCRATRARRTLRLRGSS